MRGDLCSILFDRGIFSFQTKSLRRDEKHTGKDKRHREREEQNVIRNCTRGERKTKTEKGIQGSLRRKTTSSVSYTHLTLPTTPYV